MFSDFRTDPSLRRAADHLQVSGFQGTVYAVGDIHGCLAELLDLEALIEADAPRHPGPALVVHLGDYVDRGRDSAGVLDHLLAGKRDGVERVFLKGNHESMMLDFLGRPSQHHDWLRFGGLETLASYGIFAADLLDRHRLPGLLRRRIPDAHPDFMRRLPMSFRVNRCIFVHAGMRTDIPVEQQSEGDLLWSRPAKTDGFTGQPYIVVHGHTITAQPTLVGQRVSIDTGAYETGCLTAARINARGIEFIRTARRSG